MGGHGGYQSVLNGSESVLFVKLLQPQELETLSLLQSKRMNPLSEEDKS